MSAVWRGVWREAEDAQRILTPSRTLEGFGPCTTAKAISGHVYLIQQASPLPRTNTLSSYVNNWYQLANYQELREHHAWIDRADAMILLQHRSWRAGLISREVPLASTKGMRAWRYKGGVYAAESNRGQQMKSNALSRQYPNISDHKYQKWAVSTGGLREEEETIPAPQSRNERVCVLVNTRFKLSRTQRGMRDAAPSPLYEECFAVTKPYMDLARCPVKGRPWTEAADVSRTVYSAEHERKALYKGVRPHRTVKQVVLSARSAPREPRRDRFGRGIRMTKVSSSSHEEIREKGEKGSMKGWGG
ncbi:predicted protein [Postia placenta Mad-698-R]|nr:predicted protein [Postia placenta Mad-698-R]